MPSFPEAMIARRLFCWLSAALAFGALPSISSVAVAQTNLPGVGSRVRVTPDDDMRGLIGHVRHLTADSITIALEGAAADTTLPFQRISRLQISTGKDPGLGLGGGAVSGLLIGSLAGVAFGGLAYMTCNSECGLWFLIAVPAGAVGGFVIGGIMGVARPPDRWEDVTLPRRQSGMGGLGRATRIGISIAF